MPSRLTTWVTSALVLLSAILMVAVAPAVVVGVLAPFAWLLSVWTGNPQVTMSEQLPVGAGADSFIWAAAAALGLSGSVLLHGQLSNNSKRLSRIAMVIAGLAVYLAILALPLSYAVGRLLMSLCALALVGSARLWPRVRPAKTVLFFIGIAFTVESLLWSLAHGPSTVLAFAMFTLVASFFVVTDKKRAPKTFVFGTAGLVVFLVAATVLANVPPVVTVALVVGTITASAETIRRRPVWLQGRRSHSVTFSKIAEVAR